MACFCLNRSKKESNETSTSKMLTKPPKSENQDEDDQKEDQDKRENRESAIWDCGSPLYDSYELVSLTHLIERHFMILPMSLGGSRRFIAHFSRPSGDVAGPLITASDAGSSKVANSIVELKTWKRIVSNKIKAARNISGFYNKIVAMKK